MNYDEWKLQAPEYTEYVSTCCGADYVLSIDYENDIETEEQYVCNSCQDYCDIEEEYEYEERRKESYLEDCADEKRHGY